MKTYHGSYSGVYQQTKIKTYQQGQAIHSNAQNEQRIYRRTKKEIINVVFNRCVHKLITIMTGKGNIHVY